MSAVLEPMPLPPSDGGRFRYRVPLSITTDTRRQTMEETYNEMLLWLDAKLRSAPNEVMPPQPAALAEGRVRGNRSEWQHPVSVSGEPIDFIDLYVVCEDPMWRATGYPSGMAQGTTNTVAFLLVPERLSLRDVVRRVRRMEAHARCRYVVVSSDGRFRQALQSQGIDFVPYPLPETKGFTAEGAEIRSAGKRAGAGGRSASILQ